MAKGDQIYVYRDWWNLDGLYRHHGIDCGDNTVIHYRKPSETIERTSVSTFSRGNPIYIKEYSQGFCFLPEVVVERAESRLGEHRYNILFNNCEHFATWCKTGISDSKQVREFAPQIGNFNLTQLNKNIFQALKDTDRHNAQHLLNEALHDIKIVWDSIQPEYKEALAEMATWDKVAKKALQNQREDLARRAIAKKLNYQQQARKWEQELAELAEMTENLLRDRQDLTIDEKF